ncbi:MAG: hypothetical protein C6H99_03055 [Epsilonproteobacteria bacterium]|nr:hypothetical protein [Campylobacterota bacterium]
MMFDLPPKLHNPQGEIRKAGFEIEYAGLRPKETASIIIKLFGGEMVELDEYETIVQNTKYGTFKIYLDSVYLRKDSEKYIFKEVDAFKEVIYTLSELVVPYEVVTPPIPFTELQVVEDLRLELKKAGAVGTSASVLYAFGMHINIETYSFEIQEIVDILRSFVLLQDYIIETIDVDLTRKLSWFIDPFDKEFIELILDKSYRPTKEEFIEDYITYNPTRNRALDLLPLLSYIEPSVKERLPDQKISPRPAFHYRLPNSKIDEDDWSVAFEFNQWSLVEKIAVDKSKLEDLIDEYWEFQETPFWFIKELWVERVKHWLEEELS